MTDQPKPKNPDLTPTPSPEAIAAAKKLSTMEDETLKQALEKLALESPELLAEIIKIWMGQG